MCLVVSGVMVRLSCTWYIQCSHSQRHTWRQYKLMPSVLAAAAAPLQLLTTRNGQSFNLCCNQSVSSLYVRHHHIYWTSSHILSLSLDGIHNEINILLHRTQPRRHKTPQLYTFFIYFFSQKGDITTPGLSSKGVTDIYYTGQVSRPKEWQTYIVQARSFAQRRDRHIQAKPFTQRRDRHILYRPGRSPKGVTDIYYTGQVGRPKEWQIYIIQARSVAQRSDRHILYRPGLSPKGVTDIYRPGLSPKGVTDIYRPNLSPKGVTDIYYTGQVGRPKAWQTYIIQARSVAQRSDRYISYRPGRSPKGVTDIYYTGQVFHPKAWQTYTGQVFHPKAWQTYTGQTFHPKEWQIHRQGFSPKWIYHDERKIARQGSPPKEATDN